MKIITQYLVLWALLAGLLFGQVETVKKSPGNDEITEDLVIPEGRALTVDGTLTVNGLDVGSVSSQFAARQMAGYGISDGATANRGEILTPGAIGAVAGLPMTSLAVVDVPTSNPSVVAHLAVFSSSATSASHASISLANSLYVVSGTTGILAIRQTGAVGGDYVDFRYANFRADYSGQRVRLEVSFTEGDSTTDPLIYANGVDITSEFARTTGGTVPNWMPTTLATTYVLAGYDWLAGRSPYGRAIIGALSSTESATWGTTGELPTWATQAGSAVDTLSHGEFTDFTGSTPDGWTTGVSITTAETTDGVQITGNGLTNSGNNSLTDTGGFSGFGVGDPFYYELRARRVGGSAGDILYVTRDTGDKELDLELTQSTPAWEVWSGTLTTSDNDESGQNHLRLGTTAAANWEVDYIKILRPGLIDDPYYQPALATGDRLGRMSRRLLGITPVPALGTSQVVISHTLSWDGTNHTAQSLTGGQAFEAGFVPTMISLVPDAASSGDGWTIGTSADADQYKTVASYSTGKTIYTQADFASRVPGGTGATNLDLLIDPDTANYTGSIEVTIYGSNTAGSP